MTEETFSMSFLHDLALDKQRTLTAVEQSICEIAAQAFRQADIIMLRLGGKAGRLGESVVATALLEGTLQGLSYVGKAATPVSIIVDDAVSSLFDETLYQDAYWPNITIHPVTSDQGQGIPAPLIQQAQHYHHILVLDLHGAHDAMPSLQREELATGEQGDIQRITTLAHLFRVGVRSYAERGPQRRYADFIEALFYLPTGALDGSQVQPSIRLSRENDACYQTLAAQYRLDPQALQIICFYQSVVIAKCYWRWDEVMDQFCQHMARHFPQTKISFLIACGPDEMHPEGLRQADFLEGFGNFKGTNQNAQVQVIAPSSLRDLAILTHHSALAFSDDTGPGHIAGAVQVPTITPFLPGTIYSRKIWSSTLWHRGITLDPSPFRYQQIEAAILWSHTDIIDSIPPEWLVEAAVKSLLPCGSTERS